MIFIILRKMGHSIGYTYLMYINSDIAELNYKFKSFALKRTH